MSYTYAGGGPGYSYEFEDEEGGFELLSALKLRLAKMKWETRGADEGDDNTGTSPPQKRPSEGAPPKKRRTRTKRTKKVRSKQPLKKGL